jgi:RNA polymerase sigma factor (sigma-70 family)
MDTELLNQHRAGSDSAFADIVRRHTPWIYALARRTCGDAHLAEDVVQAVFILLHRKAPHFAGDGAMINWLHKVARYAAATAARSEQRRRKRQTEVARLPSQNGSSEWNELAPLLDQLIDRLPRADRQAVLLRYYLDLNFDEVGRQTDCSAEAARKRVDRAVEKLRGMVERKGLVLSSAALTTTLIEQIRVSPPVGLIARAVTLPPTGSSLAISSQSIVKGASFMLMGKTLALSAGAFALMIALSGAIWVSEAAAPPTAVNYATLSPFSAIRWLPQVRVNGTWYELVAIDDQPIQEIMDFVQKTYGSDELAKRIDEDLVEVLTRKGYPPEATVKLQLRTLDTNKLVTIENVPMTQANRWAIWQARHPANSK